MKIHKTLAGPATASGASSRASTAHGLPPELATAAVQSLGSLALTVSFVMVAVGLLDTLYRRAMVAGAAPTRWDLIALTVALSLTLYFACRRGLLEPARLLDLGAVYQVLVGLLIGMHFHSLPLHVPVGTVGGWAPVAVWMLLYPLIVPTSTRRAVLGALATAAMDPLAYALVASAPFTRWMPWLVNIAIAAVISPIASRIAFRVSMELVRAREMGSYQLMERIGRGGMGEVWRAHHRLLARSSVIKLIRPELLGAAGSRQGQELLRRFEREARATAALRSPHTIEVYDFGTTRDGTFYYVMEYLQGFSLEALVKRFGAVPQERAVSILRQASESLAEAHLAGLLHRDVKPANIFVSRRGLEVDFVKVLDFGLVKPLGEARADVHLTAAETVVGTPAYIAPELALGGGGEVDARADIYALGCVGYWLLTGRLVFESSNAMQMMVDHIRTPPVPPSQRATQPIAPALERLILRCLAKDPEDRPRSALALRDDLAALGLEPQWGAARAAEWWSAHPPEASTPDPAAAERAAWAARETLALGGEARE
jgi:eukaryotic-like serine/threonine-protein kinase